MYLYNIYLEQICGAHSGGGLYLNYNGYQLFAIENVSICDLRLNFTALFLASTMNLFIDPNLVRNGLVESIQVSICCLARKIAILHCAIYNPSSWKLVYQ